MELGFKSVVLLLSLYFLSHAKFYIALSIYHAEEATRPLPFFRMGVSVSIAWSLVTF
jgi:hypothetical protein